MSLLLICAWEARATAYEEVLCPPYVGRFASTSAGFVVTITRERDKDVPSRVERLANPLNGDDAEAVIQRGIVQFNAHVDKESGRLFIHWDSLKAPN